MSATATKVLRIMKPNQGAGTGRELPLESIFPSKTNRTIDTESDDFKDLVASIGKWGVHTPIIVRRKADDDGDESFYELIAGERRWLASKAAEKKTILAIVRPDVSDEDALALQITENIQRENLSPLVLAEKVLLLKESGKSTKELSELLGKSERRISDILCQLDLIKPLRTVYEAGRIAYAHVMYVARLAPAAQEAALRALFRIPESDRSTTDELVKRILTDDYMRVIPERDLRTWVSEFVNLKMKAAAWNLEDGDLVPEAGPCSTCPKRSINNPEQYAPIAGNKDLCMDAACYKSKAQTFVRLQKAKAKEDEVEYLKLSDKESHSPLADKTGTIKRNQWVPAKKGECDDTAQGILVDGPSAGKKVWACTKEKCKVHPHHGIWNHGSVSQLSPEKKAEQQKRETQQRDDENAFRRAAITELLTRPIDPAVSLRAFLLDWKDTSIWPKVAEWLQWAAFPASGNSADYLSAKLADMDAAELARTLALVQCATAYDESNHYYYPDEDHREAAAYFEALGLNPQPETAAATA